MNKRIVAALVLIALVFALVACSGESRSPLVGVWSYPLGTVEFKANGEFVVYVFGMQNVGTWTEKNGKIITTFPGEEPEEVDYILSKDTLVVNGMTYTRVK